MASRDTDDLIARREEKAKIAADRAERGAEARADYDARAKAVEVNTARLKALRLERDANKKANT
jgi:hypothetical protein